MEPNNMQIIFTGDRSQIDAKTLIKFLSHFQNVVATTDKRTGEGVQFLRLKVNAIEKGSFILDLSLVEIWEGIFSDETIGYIANVFTIVTSIFSLCKKEMKGEANEEDKNENSEGDTPAVRKDLLECFNAISSDENIDGFIIEYGGRKIEFDKKQLKDFLERRRILHEEVAMLEIIELSFERGGHWKFNYNGNEIDVIVDNKELMNKIEEGERFGKGDAIRVGLQYDPMFRSYQIISYLGHFVSNGPKGNCHGRTPIPRF